MAQPLGHRSGGDQGRSDAHTDDVAEGHCGDGVVVGDVAVGAIRQLLHQLLGNRHGRGRDPLRRPSPGFGPNNVCAVGVFDF